MVRAAGIPSHFWNMDARAEVSTEAGDAGADLDHIRSAAAHARAATTPRYSLARSGRLVAPGG